MFTIKIKNLNKTYFNRQKRDVEVFKDFNLSVPANQFLTIFGPNGCGKTTLLKIIAGLIKYNSGHIDVDGKNIHEIKVGYIFQNYKQSLFPWKTNLDNIAFPLRIRGINNKECRKIVLKFLDKFGLKIPLSSYPYQISGGQKQLVAIARALIYKPHILLMDEPFGALDYKNRIFMQEKILDIWKKSNLTVVFVSHGIEEAIYLADRTVVFSKEDFTSIAKDLVIDLPRPRRQEMKGTSDFAHFLDEITETFRYVIKN